MKISEIIIGSNRRAVNQAKVRELAESIKQIGLLCPVVLTSENRLIAGLHRIEACKSLGHTEILSVTVTLDDLNAELAEIDENLIRNELSALERGDQLARRKEIYEEIYPQTKHGGDRKSEKIKRRNLPLDSEDDKSVDAEVPAFVTDTAGKTGRSERVIREEIQISRDIIPEVKAAIQDTTLANNKTVLKAISEMPKIEQTEIVAKGEKEIIAKAKEIQAKKREVKRVEIIEKLENIETKKAKELSGVYDVIVIDPPWAMQKIERDERPNQSEFDYPTMSIEEISNLKLPCADSCHVFLWTTHKFLPDAFELLNKWDLKYICCMVWHKPGGFQPYNLPQYNCEFVLYARKGNAQFIDTKAFPVCFNAPRGAHSEKPQEFYDLVNRVTAGRKLDMFNRREITGFDGWGNESNDN